MSSHPLQADLPDGGVFFEIGQNVRVRRYSPSKNSYSDWFDGTVVRPVAVEFDRMGKRLKSFQRRYMCLYDDPHYQEWIEREFSPELHEIASLDCPLVFAPIPVTNASGNKQVVYLPAMVLTSPNREGGVHLHILTGRAEAKREISNFAIQYARPYTQESAQYLRQNCLPFLGDGIKRSF
ncbi:hypothetical protein C8R46DRAFT_1215887 [Mycena filopes]|nr:hypothetical protein C8R46DRAFT_1215887 [Mycena filopes]